MSRDSETVSKNMRSIHSKDTSIELQLSPLVSFAII